MRLESTPLYLLSLVFSFLTGPFLLSQEESENASEEPAEEATVEDAEPEDPGAAEEGESPADKDSVADKSKDSGNYWVVDFQPTGLRMIAPEGGAGAGRTYWYLLYELSNPAAEDRQLFVTITATSDHGKEYADLFLPSVERAIERKEGRTLWGKTDEFELVSRRKPSDPRYRYITLKAGEKRQCVAVFNRLDPTANHITLRVSGLSNEIAPVEGEGGKRFLEERLREFSYERAGDDHAITLDSFKATGRQWTRRRIPAAGPAS